jgi:NAD(P)H-nitrite reductase large subunit
MTESTGHVLVVGASLGGLRAAEQLRAADHSGAITVVGEEAHLPYNRPPLSKEILADEGDDDPARLHAKLAFSRRASVSDVTFLLGRQAVAADLTARMVTLDDGTVLSYDGLVVATGLRPRRLDVPGPQAGRFAIRTLDDAVAVRKAVRGAPPVVVIGGGFVGIEAASTLRRQGLDVTVTCPEAIPQARVLGDEAGSSIRRHLEAAGIRFETGVSIAGLTGEATVVGVALSDGRTLRAGVVIEAIGSLCNVEWLAGNGLDLSDGAACDNNLSVAGAPDVVAVGDIARFPNPLFDDVPRRVEHWSMPAETAKRAAATLVAGLTGRPVPPTPFTPVPSFWSDQLDLRLQAYGSPALGPDARVEEGDTSSPRDGLKVTYHRDGQHVGTLAVSLPPGRLRELRQAFGSSLSPA